MTGESIPDPWDEDGPGHPVAQAMTAVIALEDAGAPPGEFSGELSRIAARHVSLMRGYHWPGLALDVLQAGVTEEYGPRRDRDIGRWLIEAGHYCESAGSPPGSLEAAGLVTCICSGCATRRQRSAEQSLSPRQWEVLGVTVLSAVLLSVACRDDPALEAELRQAGFTAPLPGEDEA